MNRTKSAFLALLAVLLSPIATNADIIDSNGPSSGLNSSIPGVSLTTGAGGPWNDILFNFFNYSAAGVGSSAASGNLFILSNSYNGTPGDLSSSTPGFLAQSISSTGGMWQFDSSVILSANTQYWFLVGTGFSWDGTFGAGGDTTTGGAACFALSETSNYTGCGVGPTANWDYVLQGTRVPEPGTLALFGLGLAALGLSRRRRTS